MTTFTLFRPGRTSVALIPNDAAASTWGGGETMRGMAVSAALARGADRHVRHIDDGWVAGRWSVDFGRPAAMEECRVVARTVRQGRRLLLVDVVMEQGDGRVVAWGRGAFVRPAAASAGRVWEPARAAVVPPAALLPTAQRLYWSEVVGWTSDPDDHHNSTRKGVWQRRFLIVEGEETRSFPFIAGAADIASVATQWGDLGVRYINLDLSLHLSRVPDDVSDGIGIVAIHRATHEGQAIGTAELADVRGPIGSASVTAIQNEAQVGPHQLRSLHR